MQELFTAPSGCLLNHEMEVVREISAISEGPYNSGSRWANRWPLLRLWVLIPALRYYESSKSHMRVLCNAVKVRSVSQRTEKDLETPSNSQILPKRLSK